MDNTISFGQFIKKHRIKSGMKSQRMLADKMSVSNTTISKIEREIHTPEAKTLIEMSKHLTSTSLTELLAVCGYLDGNSNGVEINKLELTKDEILSQYDVQIDNRSLTDTEKKLMVAAVRAYRSLNEG